MSNVPLAVVLGIAQDGGVPHPGCDCQTCLTFSTTGNQLSPASIGVIDGDELHLIDVSRDLNRQLRMLPKKGCKVTDVWLTHGHLGHVDGIGLFGREAMGAKGIRIHASDSMMKLIEGTPRWKTMIDDGILIPCPFKGNMKIQTSQSLSITPVQVPHRDEWTDTHAFIIRGPSKSILHLPDHDTWKETLEMVGMKTIHEWFHSLEVDTFLIDGTFWSSDELEHQKNVPHPPVLDTLQRLGMKRDNAMDIRFIHLNHTNPLLNPESKETKHLKDSGWSLVNEGEHFPL